MEGVRRFRSKGRSVFACYKVAGAKLQADDRAGARAAYQEELAILQRLAASNVLTPDQQGWIVDAQQRLSALASNP